MPAVPRRRGRLRSRVSMVLALTITACTSVGGGNFGNAVSGSAGATGAEGSVQLTRCNEPLATVTANLQRVNQQALIQFGLPSNPFPALRLIMQQSNCVRVVHRDVVLDTMRQERELAAAGELKANHSFSRGQMVAADYTVLPEITFSDRNSGGIGAGLLHIGGFFGLPGAIASTAIGGLRFSEAQVLLTLVDNRSGEQLAVASGSGSGTSFGGLGAVVGSTTVAAGGYYDTNEGKVVMAAMVDAMNKLIPHLRKSIPKPTRTSQRQQRPALACRGRSRTGTRKPPA